MKFLLSVLALGLVSASAFADQSIVCHEINKSGSRKANGTSLKAELFFNQDGSLSKRAPNRIELKGFWKKDSGLGEKFEFLSTQQSKLNAENQWAHVFFNDAFDGGMVEYQLQFNQPILNRNFRDERAKLVAGVENNSSEPMPSWGVDLECNGYVN